MKNLFSGCFHAPTFNLHFFRFSEDSDSTLKEVFEEVSNLTSQNKVAILKTYGAETPLERSAELGALGEKKWNHVIGDQ